MKKLFKQQAEDRERYYRANVKMVAESLIKFQSNNLDSFDTLYNHDIPVEEYDGNDDYDVEYDDHVWNESDGEDEEFMVPVMKMRQSQQLPSGELPSVFIQEDNDSFQFSNVNVSSRESCIYVDEERPLLRIHQENVHHNFVNTFKLLYLWASQEVLDIKSLMEAFA